MRPRSKYQFTPPQVLVLGFGGLILLGTILLWLPITHEVGRSVSFADALFTATSAVCVTGLVVVDTATTFNLFGELVILGLIQAGGLGIMTLSALTLLLLGKRVTLKERLLMQEALGSFSIAGVVRLCRNIIITTLIIEVAAGLLLSLRWLLQYPWQKAFYWGFFHTISAFNNAGFDVTSESMRPFARDPYVLAIIGGLLILGGIGFPVLQDVWRQRRWDRLSLHSRLAIKMTVGLMLVGMVFYLIGEWSNSGTFAGLPWYHKLSNAWFASITPRTAGFETVMTGSLREFSLLLTIILMFVGASPGGTGGGVKTTTFALIMASIRSTSTGREEVTIMGRRIPKDLIDKAFSITSLAMLLIVVVSMLLFLTEQRLLTTPGSDHVGMDIIFEVVSAFGTVGLTTGLTPFLSAAGKILITLTMFIGRVGPLTMAVALAQRSLGRSPIHYPEDRVMIG